MRLAYIALITNCKGSLYIGIINHIELVSSSARVTSVKFQKALGCRERQTPRPIDQTPGTPGSGKNEISSDQFVSEPVTMINAGDASASSEKRLKPVLQGRI